MGVLLELQESLEAVSLGIQKLSNHASSRPAGHQIDSVPRGSEPEPQNHSLNLLVIALCCES